MLSDFAELVDQVQVPMPFHIREILTYDNIANAGCIGSSRGG